MTIEQAIEAIEDAIDTLEYVDVGVHVDTIEGLKAAVEMLRELEGEKG